MGQRATVPRLEMKERCNESVRDRDICLHDSRRDDG
ncbi:hypothetical protein XFF7766_570100 [Xanthomonas citri pv. fuscans]|nr:hypothetical protein XFF7766_570100 [Xanthomonas citri pv. fuscans]